MNKTWTDAIEFCRKEGGKLSTLDKENIEVVLQGCVKNDSVGLWTNTYRHTSPYLSLTGTSDSKYVIVMFSVNCQKSQKTKNRFCNSGTLSLSFP